MAGDLAELAKLIKTIASEAITLSQLDSDRFGIRVARSHITSENLADVLEACRDENVSLLIARCATSDLRTVQVAEEHGFFLTDTLLYYRCDLHKLPMPALKKECHVRPLLAGDAEQVQRVAAQAFQGYMGHYHADPRLDRRKCDEAYRSWAERSCVPGSTADKVLVAEYSGQVAGFGTLRKNSPAEVEGLLFGVAPEYQGRGICGALMISSLQWSLSQGSERMIISTQVTNVSMQKVWCRVGFEPSHSFYTFHRWFDR